MTEQQRAEYMAIVAAIAGGYLSPRGDIDDVVAKLAMQMWVAANKEANEAKP
jgi:hypothetical protein